MTSLKLYFKQAPLSNGHFFQVPRVVVVQRFDCTCNNCFLYVCFFGHLSICLSVCCLFLFVCLKNKTLFSLRQGTSYDSKQVSSKEECLQLCKGDARCIWFTHFSSSKMCLLYTDCLTVDETCDECVSGEFSCVPDFDVPKGNTLVSHLNIKLYIKVGINF
jgi:hypothetical protein